MGKEAGGMDWSAGGCWFRKGGVIHFQAVSTPHLSTQVSAGCLTNFPMDLRVMLFNVRSIDHKNTLIHDKLVDEGIDLACVTNTWVGGGCVCV